MRSVLIDTNLLVLLVVGYYKKTLIGQHKRTKEFVPEDFDLLRRFLSGYDILWVTSYCLAEASNLLKQTHPAQAKGLLNCMSAIVSRTKESHMSKEVLFGDERAARLGVADTGIFLKSKRVDCVLTRDFNLYREVSTSGRRVVNFNHLRAETLLA